MSVVKARGPARPTAAGSGGEPGFERAARWIGTAAPLALAALAGVLLVWSRLAPLTISLWNDESYSAVAYIQPGPSAIFGTYIPNDHVLFELLSWFTTNLLGDSSEAVLRFWSAAPAIAAVVIMSWWLWRRLDPWTAAIFAVLGASAPLTQTLGIQARGYGLSFLAAVVMTIGMDGYVRLRQRRDLLVMCAGALVGLWTLPVFVVAFLALTGLLLTRPGLRRETLTALVAVGAATLLLYSPVLGDLLGSAGQNFGSRLPWYGVVSGPLGEQLSPSVSVILPSVSFRETEVIAALVIAAGLVGLWLRPERYLALALLAPAALTYAVLEVGRLQTAGRFVSYLELPLLALCAIGLVTAGRVLTRAGPYGSAAAALCAIAFSLFTLGKAESAFSATAQLPIENVKALAGPIRAAGVGTVVTNSSELASFVYYLGPGAVQRLPAIELSQLFCSNVAPFVYVENGVSPGPSTSCLSKRGAVSIEPPQQRFYMRAWFVPANATGGVAIPAVAPNLSPTAAPRSATTACAPVIDTFETAPPVAPLPVGQATTASLAHSPLPIPATIRVSVTGARILSSIPGGGVARSTTFTSPNGFLAVGYRLTNLGPDRINPEHVVDALFGLYAHGATIASAPTLDAACKLAADSVALASGEALPTRDLPRGATVSTVAVYPLPASLANPAVIRRSVRWAASSQRLSLALPRP